MDIAFAGFTLKAQERLLLGPDGSIDIGAKAVDVLRALIARPHEVVSKDTLLSEAWPGVIVEENALQAQISTLRKVLGPEMIVTVHGRGYKYAGPPPSGRENRSDAGPIREDRKPVVAVLPFANLSGDSEQQYFSDGMTEDIIDRLSRFRMLDVIGWHSALALQGADGNLQEVRNRLSADYVVTGNVRRSNGRLRIAARLTDTLHETVLWAERYDRIIEDVFAIQDEVAEMIAGTLTRHVEVNMAVRVRPAGDFTSYETVLKGMTYLRSDDPGSLDLAAGCFRRALEISPRCAEAMRGLSAFHISRWLCRIMPEDIAMAVAYGRQGSDIDPSNADCLACLGLALVWASGVDAATPAMQRALEINPGDSYVLADASVHAVYDGRIKYAHTLLAIAMRLNPIPPRWFAVYQALLDFAEGRFAQAARGFSGFDTGKYQMAYYAASLAHAGDLSALADAMAGIRLRGWDLTEVLAIEPHRNPTLRQQLADGLERALSN